ncbi:DNA-binding protein WhiA [uncultured Dialister sp.]|jgi:DNA-binding protein WhiA|nr:DNA-binding protein WhiA [uncultured Dialister sp.]
MSFTEQVKNELARIRRDDKSCRTAELLALLRMSGSFITGSGGRWGLEFSTGNSAVARRVLVYLKKDFGFMPSAMVRQGRRLRKKNVYTLVVQPSEQGLAFLDTMGLSPMAAVDDEAFLETMEEKRAYLAGAFLGGGSVSRPQSDYHLEMVTQSYRFAEEIVKTMAAFKLNARMTDRKNDYIVYIKDGDEVSELLQILGASQSYLDFESVRVVKDMRNRVNRQVNCETANLQKTVDAAVHQTHMVQKLLDRVPRSSLSPKIREACDLRLANPNASLAELAALCGITKSGLAHRFKKIEALAGEKHSDL